jgi:ATP-dependent DNA helicase UvrD/PcrA
MSDATPFVLPRIDDEDIRWASRLLELPEDAFYGKNDDDPRQDVLKSNQTMDIAACPGSGKTTLLVAKLAILAQKWQHRTRGICVLSHTNAARHQIEAGLGNTAVGKRLLSYPHFIGTIHGFVNDFLAVPWLRSKGYPIRMIDTDVCLDRRWNALPFPTRSGLERNHHNRSVLTVKSSDCDVGDVSWGRGGVLGPETETYRAIVNACQRSTKEGYFCYDEMFVWAQDLMDNRPWITDVIRDRFPLLFIDEAQDNSEGQSAILHRIFVQNGSEVIRQRFGDANQAIFDFVGAKEAATDEFPTDSVKTDLPNSYRFGQKIADLADPLGYTPYGMVGEGPAGASVLSAVQGQHTIFLFEDDSILQVLKAYGELIIQTFSDQEVNEGTFVAIGHVHRPPNSTGTPRLPHCVGDYWSGYDPELARSDPRLSTFVQHVFVGQGKAQAAGEACLAVENIGQGILRLARMTEARPTSFGKRHCHRRVLRHLDENRELRDYYEKFVVTFAGKRDTLTESMWNDSWRQVVRQIAEAVAGAPLLGSESDSFFAWENPPALAVPNSTALPRDNTYRVSGNGKEVQIRIGSIHSVKGQTHTATLVLETFWYSYNLTSLRNWLIGAEKGGGSAGTRDQTRLKTHYVAMTRPTHLLCLAMKRSDFETCEHELTEQGWQVVYV